VEEQEPQEDAVPQSLSQVVESLPEWQELEALLRERYPNERLVPFDFWGPLASMRGIIAQHFPSNADPRM
jgi:hypothetical protein